MGVLDRRGGGGLNVTVDASPSVDVHRPRSLRESRRASNSCGTALTATAEGLDIDVGSQVVELMKAAGGCRARLAVCAD